MNNKKIFFIIIICGLVLTLIPSFVFAAEYQCWCKGSTGNDLQMGDNFSSLGACNAQCAPAPGLLCEGYTNPSCKEAATKQPSPSGGSQTTGKLTNPLGEEVTQKGLPFLIGRVINAILGIVGSIALLMFIYGGFMWLTSSGNEQRITKGKQILTWAVIGLTIIFLSYTLVGFVISSLTKGAAGEGNPQSSTSGGCCSTAVTCFNANSEAECKSTGAGSNKFSPGMKCTDVGGAMVCS